jgi:type IV pilus assembly protein PilC
LTGEPVEGSLEAETEAAAVSALQNKNLFVVDVRPALRKKREIAGAGFLGPRVSQRGLALFCRQFAVMVEAGVPAFQALSILAAQVENVYFGRVLQKVVTHLEEGYSLSDAFGLFPQVFPPIFTRMLEVGEVSGALQEILARLAVHFEKEHEIREEVRNALAYPAVVLAITALAVGVMLTFVLPAFARILGDLNVPLPLPTKMLLEVGVFVRRFWYLLVPALILLVTTLKYFFGSTVEGKEIGDRLVLRLPLAGPVVHKVIIARFARTLSTMLKSGVPVVIALEVVRKAAGNVVIERAIERTIESISEGGSIAGLLEKSGVFTPVVTRMIAIGEETGALEELLEKVAAFYEQDVAVAVKRLSVTVEPLLILILGGIVGSIILSVLMPIFSIYGAIR